MPGFDDLRKQAESLLGKNATDELERRFGSERGSPYRQDRLVDVRKADFVPERKDKKIPHQDDPAPANSQGTTKYEVHATDVELARPERAPQTVIENSSHGAKLIGTAIWGEYIYGILGLVLGLSSIIGGIVLGLHGVAGSTSWTAEVLGLKSTINDAAPGVVLFIVGLFMVWVTKPKVRLRDIRG